MEFEIEEGADIIGKTIRETGLERLPGFYPSRINRNDREIAPVPKDEKLLKGDHLLYAAKDGIAAKAHDLVGHPGFFPDQCGWW